MKEHDFKQTPEFYTKLPGEILWHNPKLTDQFNQLINGTSEIFNFFNAFAPDQMNDEKMSEDKKNYLGEKLTTVIIISLGMLEHMGCNFKQIFDEKMQRLEGLYKTDEAKKIITNYRTKAEKTIKHIVFSNDK